MTLPTSGLPPGTHLGPYEIVAPIGAGGMGEVYRARDARLGRDVAIKVLPTTMSADPERLRRFELEARSAAALNHPGILAVYDLGTESGAPYIVSELLEGETLRARLSRGRGTGSSVDGASGISTRKAIDYAVQIAKALSAAHEKGIVHRDLKPENLFITSDGRVKILDFGLAKLTEKAPVPVSEETLLSAGRSATDAGTVLGTMGYMAPEQLRAQAVDHRADLFAFGAVLYEMLSGQRAFRGETPADTISAILDKEPPDLPSVGARIPPALARVVERCLEKAPAARFQSAHDLAFALDSLSSPSDSGQTAALPAFSGSSRRVSGQERLAWGTLVGGLALMLVGAGVAAFRRPAVAAPTLRLSIHPPPGLTLGAGTLAISPDGSRVAYVARRSPSEPQMLWLQSFDAFEAKVLPGTEAGGEMFWSPDGKRLGFVAEGKLKTINVEGGAVQTVADVGDGSLGASWGKDDVVLVGSIFGGLMRIAASGGPPVPVTALDKEHHEEAHRRPTFMPDSRHFTYVALPGNHVFLASIDSSERKELFNADSQAVYSSGYLFFVRQGAFFAQPFNLGTYSLSGDAFEVATQMVVNPVAPSAAFSVSANGSLVYETGVNRGNATIPMQLRWFDRGGRSLGTASDVSDYRSIEMSPNGRRLAEHHHNLESGGDIWLRDLERGGTTRLTFGGHNTEAVWSPDGSRVIYSSNLDASGKAPQDISAGPFNLFSKRADGGEEATVLLDSAIAGIPTGWKQPTSWSVDGQTLLFDLIDPKTSHDIWMLPLSGERKPRPWLQTPFREMSAQISPDGRWVAYQSNETRRYEIYVRPLSGTEKVSISTTGGAFARWRPDGKELYYVSLDNNLMVVPIRTTASGFEAGTPQTLFPAHVAFSGGGVTNRGNTPFPYSVTRDGQRFLVSVDVSPTVQTPPISVVINWPDGVKK